MTAGSAAPALAAGELLIDTTTASADHLRVGSVAAVVFAQTGPTKLRIGGIYQSNALVGSFVVGDAVFVAHFDNPEAGTILVSGAPGLESTFNSALSAYPDLTIQTRAQYEAAQQKSINSLLGLIYVMLALAVLIALIGIVNTLMLSVFERTREIGLLRAVGMKRPQVRAMIRSESVIIALFGAVTGLLIGTALGVSLAASLRQSGVSIISVPASLLIVFLILAALLGVAAARWPARRAARLDVLTAIATE